MPTKLGLNICYGLTLIPVLWFLSFFGSFFFHVLETLLLVILFAIVLSPPWPDHYMDYVTAALINKKRFFPPNTPSVLALVTYFDECPKYDEVLKCKSVLLQYERFTSVPIPAPAAFESGWKKEVIKLEDHVLQIELDDEGALEEEVENLTLGVLRPLDPKRPLWRVDILRCANGRSAVVWLVDHSIGDGLRLLPIGLSYCTNLDGSRYTPPEFSPKERGKKPSLFKILSSSVRDIIDLVKIPNGRFDSVCGINRNALKPRIEYDGNRAIAHTEFDLSDINNIKKAAMAASSGEADISVNDILTACWAGTLRRYLQKENDPALEKPDLLIRGQAPAAFPRPTISGKVFVKMAFVVFRFPVHLSTAISRILEVHHEWYSFKHSPKIFILEYVPSLLLKLGLDWLVADTNHRQWHRTSFIFSNVPGPREPILMFGKRVVTLRPYYCNLLHQVIFFSYDGKVSLSLVIDKTNIKDPQMLVKCFHEELEGMKKELITK